MTIAVESSRNPLLGRPSDDSTWRDRWSPYKSTRLYLSVLIVGSSLGLWAGYLWPATPVFMGQAPAVLVPIVSFLIAIALWYFVEKRLIASRMALTFLFLLSIAWFVNLAAFRFHGDAFTYGAVFFIPIMVMIGMKPPTATEVASTLVAFAWAVTTVLVSTRAFEVFGIVEVKAQPAGVISFDEEYYWLPLNDTLGIDGRWPGPFGHNGYTSMMAAFILVIAIAFWQRSSWVFLTVGVFVLIITSGRASAGAAAAGIILLGTLTNQGAVARVPRGWRITVGSALLAAGVIFLLAGRSGVTGRQYIWPAFFDLWKTSPWMGAGARGIAENGGVTQKFGHAHSLYLDLLARDGLFAFVTVMAALVVGVGITFVAGLRGYPGPLALVATYLITGITEPRNDWIHPGVNVLVIVICVMGASDYLRYTSSSGNSRRSVESPSVDSHP